jgi:predicted nucleic acid-binding protein
VSADFFDTNILVYAASEIPLKAARAEELLRAGGVVSVQVLNELALVARRKMKLTWAETRELVEPYALLLTVVPMTQAVHERGLALGERYGFAVYDAMLMAAALEAGCEVFWSEDMHNGLVVEGRLRVVNPF